MRRNSARFRLAAAVAAVSMAATTAIATLASARDISDPEPVLEAVLNEARIVVEHATEVPSRERSHCWHHEPDWHYQHSGETWHMFRRSHAWGTGESYVTTNDSAHIC